MRKTNELKKLESRYEALIKKSKSESLNNKEKQEMKELLGKILNFHKERGA